MEAVEDGSKGRRSQGPDRFWKPRLKLKGQREPDCAMVVSLSVGANFVCDALNLICALIAVPTAQTTYDTNSLRVVLGTKRDVHAS